MGKKSREKKERLEEGQEILKPESSNISWIWWLILTGTCFILFTPFVISGNYFFPFVGPKSIYFMALAEIIFALWLILIIFNPKYRPKMNALVIVLFLFMGVQAVSSVLGVDFFRSFWSKYERMTGLLMQIHLFVFFLVISSVFKKKTDWLKIFGVSVIAACLMGLMTLSTRLQEILLGEMAPAARGGVTIGNSSFLGTYLLFNIFFAIYLIVNLKSWLKFLSVFGLILISIALFFSTARAALLSTAGGIVLLVLFWLLLNKEKKLKRIGFIFVAALILLVGFSVFLATKPGNPINRIVINNVGSSFGGRLPVWKSGWEGLAEKPLLGWGLENFEIVFARHFNPCFLGPNCGSDIWYDRAHNIVVDTLVTTGFLGMLLYLGIFGTVFYILWRKFLNNSLTFWSAGIFSAILIAYFVQNLTVFDMVSSYMLFFLVLGFVGSISSGANNEGDVRLQKKPIHYILSLIVLFVFIFSFTKLVVYPERADRYSIMALRYAVGSQDRIDYYRKTLDTSMVGTYQLRDFFAQSVMEKIQSNGDASITESVKSELDYLSAEMEKTIKESPLDFRGYLKLGQLYNLYAILTRDSLKLSRADEVLQKAIETSPTNQQGYWSLAQTRIYEGRMEDALSLAEKALNLEPKSRQSNLIVIQIARIMGNDALAKQKAEEALRNNPALQEDIKNILSE